jgi:hypothetical protein
MSKNLNEEIIRMQSLFNFKVGDNAHDVLSEQNIKKAVLKEQGNSKSATLVQAKKDGYNVIYMQKEPVSVDDVLPALNNLFYANFVTVDKGLKAEGKTALDAGIAKALKTLEEFGTTTENLTINIESSASADKAKNDAHDNPNESSIDHNYEGKSPNNEYLAKSRGEHLAAYIKDKMPGVTVTVTSSVSESVDPSGRFAKFTGKWNKDITSYKPAKDFRVGWTLNAIYETTKEWNTRHASKDCDDARKELCGCQIPDATDNRENDAVIALHTGKRVLGIGPAGLEATTITYGYKWSADSNFIPKKKVEDGTNSQGEKTYSTQSCQRLEGNDSINGIPLTHLSSYEAMGRVLSSSGYFTKEDAKAIILLLSAASPRTESVDDNNPFTVLMRDDGAQEKVIVDNWDKFVRAMQASGIGTGSFSEDLAIKNGAVVIKDGKVIAKDGREV